MINKDGYPTLAEYEKVADAWNAIKNFYDGSTVVPAEWGDGAELIPVWDLDKRLADYFDIDLELLEAERRQLLEEAMGA